MRVTETNNVVRISLSPDEYLEISNGFYGTDEPGEVEFEDESGTRTVIFTLDVSGG